MSNPFESFLKAAAGRPLVQARLVRALRTKSKTDEANALALELWRGRGSDPKAEVLFRQELSRNVPEWHFRLVHDTVRNDAYEAALKRAVRPGSRVLDIGSGTGLLALMAARAGAAHVYTCEMNPAVADAAREIIAANGYSDRITMLPMHSSKIDAERDLGGKVDVLVSEIVSSDMLSEMVLSVMEDTVPRLLKPGGALIPARGVVKVALVHDPAVETARMGRVSGFDLSLFNRLAQPYHGRKANGADLQLRSEPAELFRFDFAATKTPEAEAACEVVATGGEANAIAQWIHLQMDDEETYENPPTTASSWWVRCWPLTAPHELQAGERCVIGGMHDRRQLHLWLETK